MPFHILPVTGRPLLCTSAKVAAVETYVVTACLLAVFLVGCSKEDGAFKEYSEQSPTVAATNPEPSKTAAVPAEPAMPETASNSTESPAAENARPTPPSTQPVTTEMKAPSQESSAAPPQERFRRRASRPKAESTDPPPAPAKPREIKLLIPQNTFKIEGPQKAIRVTYDDIDLLRVLNMEEVTASAAQHFPDWLKQLNGRRIRLRGFMYPPLLETGLTSFGFARDNQICCFGRNPKIYDLFRVDLRDGVTVDYIQNRPFDVVGVFHIQPESIDGQLFQLYRIDNAVVID